MNRQVKNSTLIDYIEDVDLSIELMEVPERRAEISMMLPVEQLILTIARFSTENDKSLVGSDVVQSINFYDKYFQFTSYPGDYCYFIWLFSLSYLCGVDDEHMQKLIAIVKRDGIKDQLLDYLIRSYDPSYDGEAGQFLHPIPYGNLAPILNSTPSDSDLTVIKNYLDKHWYQGHADEENFDASWIDLHKDAPDRFFGYWAWETAAIAKIKGLDDELLKDHKYYPYRAVHW